MGTFEPGALRGIAGTLLITVGYRNQAPGFDPLSGVGVFHKGDGVWKFVQTHASIPQGNAEVGWDYG